MARQDRPEKEPLLQVPHYLVLEGGDKKVQLQFIPPGSPFDRIETSIALKGRGSGKIAEELRRELESLGFKKSGKYSSSLIKKPEKKQESTAIALPSSPEFEGMSQEERANLVKLLETLSEPEVAILDRNENDTRQLADAGVLPEDFSGSHYFHINYSRFAPLGSNYYDEKDFKRIYAAFCQAAEKFLPKVNTVRISLHRLYDNPVVYDEIKHALPEKPDSIHIEGPTIPQNLFSGAKINVTQQPRSNREKNQPQWGPETWGHWYRNFIFKDCELHQSDRGEHNNSEITYSISGASALKRELGKVLTQEEISKRIVEKPMHPQHEEDSYWQPYLQSMRLAFGKPIPHAEARELGIKKSLSPVPGFQRKALFRPLLALLKSLFRA